VDGVVDLQVDQPLSLDGAVVEDPGELETDDPVDPGPDQDRGGGGAGSGVRPLLRVRPVPQLPVEGAVAGGAAGRCRVLDGGQQVDEQGHGLVERGLPGRLARHAGARVIGTASPRHHEALRELGVEPLDYRDPDVSARVRELAPGGVDAVFAHLGGASIARSYRLLNRTGPLVCYSIASKLDDSTPVSLSFLHVLTTSPACTSRRSTTRRGAAPTTARRPNRSPNGSSRRRSR
jgi:hypothetical protein